MLRILFYNAAIQVVPESWRNQKKIQAYYKKYKRFPLINGSVHQHLLKKAPLDQRLDRPDILHFSLLLTLNLLKEYQQQVEVLFHLANSNEVFIVDPETRLPRDQQRFYGVLENLLQFGTNPYIKQMEAPLHEHLKGSKIYIFDQKGKIKTKNMKLHESSDITLVYGAFAHGTLTSESFLQSTHLKAESLTLSNNELELWTAIALSLPHVTNM